MELPVVSRAGTEQPDTAASSGPETEPTEQTVTAVYAQIRRSPRPKGYEGKRRAT
jgi:hypothetical protein